MNLSTLKTMKRACFPSYHIGLIFTFFALCPSFLERARCQRSSISFGFLTLSYSSYSLLRPRRKKRKHDILLQKLHIPLSSHPQVQPRRCFPTQTTRLVAHLVKKTNRHDVQKKTSCETYMYTSPISCK